MNQIESKKNIKEITLKRIFEIDREILFDMWTKPEHVSKWFGPKNFDVADCTINLKPNGEFLINMKSPEGKIYPSTGIFREFIRPEKLVFSLVSHFDDNGNPQMEMLNTLTFSEKNGLTTMVMIIKEVKSPPEIIPLKGLDIAWNQSFDKLVAVLKN